MTAESRITIVTLVILLLGLGLMTERYGTSGGIAEPTAPVQPIDFFHRVHAGVKGISCYFCHRSVRSAAFAGMPSTELCMRCHRVVIPHHWEIQRLHQYWEAQQSVPWVRVNHLPGFVYFDHQAHVAAGVQCAHCHGSVVDMDRMRQVVPLSMGWCLACHHANKAPEDCWTCHR